MKKAVRIVCIALAALVSVAGLEAQVYEINFANLPQDPVFRKHLEEFDDYYQYVTAWTPEWKAKVPKSKVVVLMEKLHNEAQAFIAKGGADQIDLLLFRSLMKSCLYNANITSYHEPLIKELKELKTRFPKDYRIGWMLANHHASADEVFLAMREYDGIMMNKAGVSSFLLLQDYLSASFFTFMYSRCDAMITNILSQNRVPKGAATFWMYQHVKDQLRQPPVDVLIPEGEAFVAQSREFETGFLSRPLGIWIPVKSDWKLEALPITATGGSVFTMTVPFKNAKGVVVNATMSITFLVNQKGSFDDYIKSSLAKPTGSKALPDLKVKWPAQAYEFWDTESFKASGGGRGLVVYVKRSTPPVKGLAIEAPARMPSRGESQKSEYVVMGDGYTRFSGDIYYAFAIECPESVFNQAKPEFLGFLERVLLD